MDRGEYTQTLTGLASAADALRNSWLDEVGRSFACMNENVEKLSEKLWGQFAQATDYCNKLKANYNASDYDGKINSLRSRAADL